MAKKKSQATRPSYYSYEIQLLDDAGDTPGKGSTGSLYRYVAPSKNVVKAGPEWNRMEVECAGPRITVTLNGQKIHDQVECDKATGSEIDKNVTEPGPIFLQGDHGAVSFRNIRIKELP